MTKYESPPHSSIHQQNLGWLARIHAASSAAWESHLCRGKISRDVSIGALIVLARLVRIADLLTLYCPFTARLVAHHICKNHEDLARDEHIITVLGSRSYSLRGRPSVDTCDDRGIVGGTFLVPIGAIFHQATDLRFRWSCKGCDGDCGNSGSLHFVSFLR